MKIESHPMILIVPIIAKSVLSSTKKPSTPEEVNPHSSARISLRIQAFVKMRIPNAVVINTIVATPTPKTAECSVSGSSKFDVCPGGGIIAGISSNLNVAMVKALAGYLVRDDSVIDTHL